ncbi:hypothetical protein TNCV_4041 [Trichonephila clavipes]|nr:hypothetical protein TNCV_4041 [Trichonephila clavipes]
MTTKGMSKGSLISSTAAPNQGPARAFAFILWVHRWDHFIMVTIDVKHINNVHNAAQLVVRNATSDGSKLRPRRLQDNRHRRMKYCRTRSNKSGVLAMSTEAKADLR